MNDALINALLRAPAGIASRVRIAFLQSLGARIGQNCRVVRPVVPKNPWDISLGDGVALDCGVVLLATGPRLDMPRITIGSRTYVNRGTMFDASLSVTVGPDVMIGPYTYITDHDHGVAPGKRVADAPLIEARVVIGERVWLGAGVIVLKGVTIGEGSVVGAGAVVTRDVPSGARVVGVPARLKPREEARPLAVASSKERR